MKHKFFRIFTHLIVFVFGGLACQVYASKYSTQVVVEGINVPWGMAQLPNGNLLVTERAGELYLVDTNKSSKQKVSGLPKISARGQGGLLDIELHPEYEKNGWIYLSFASPEGQGDGDNTAIIRAKLKSTQLTDIEVIFKANPNSNRKHHYGSRLEFDKKGYLYFSIGDRGERDVLPQDVTRHGGKIYRIHDDGRIPADNPFVNNKQAKPEIYSYGHRNPQGMAMHPQTGEIWTHEHGPKGGDEVNIIKPAVNYGWPVISYGVNYSGTKFTDLTEKEGMEQPIWYWVPSIAPSGMTFVTSDKYPQWKNHLLVGSLKFGNLVLCQLKDNRIVEQKVVLDDLVRVRNVKQMPDGYIYVATDNNKIVRVIAN